MPGCAARPPKKYLAEKQKNFFGDDVRPHSGTDINWAQGRVSACLRAFGRSDMQTGMRICEYAGVRVYRQICGHEGGSGVRVYRQACGHAGMRALEYAGRYADMRAFGYADAD